MSKTTIDKATEAAEHPILLETQAQLDKAQKSWKQSEILGIDTEFVRERTYRADLGLVQISDGETAWLFDPLAIKTSQAMAEVLTDPGIVKVLHSGSEDLEVLLNAMKVIPEPLVDTQIACAMLGQPLQLGYHHAVKWLFDIEIDKDQTRSNWCKRPLHANQLRYAAMDVVLLPEMLRALRTKLEQAGRWGWLEEDVARMQRNARCPVDPDKAYLRFSGIGRMDETTLRVMKYLARWRELTARERNRARGFVISDAGMLRLASARPSSVAEMQAIDDIHPVALSMYGEKLLELISAAASDHSPLIRLNSLDEKQRRQVKEMRKLVVSKSAELKVDPALLASRRELEKLIRAGADGSPLPDRFLGWRKDVITDHLLALSESRKGPQGTE